MNWTENQLEQISLKLMDDLSRSEMWDTIDSPKDFQDILKVNLSKMDMGIFDLPLEESVSAMTDVVTSSYKEYQIFETDKALMNLIDKGMIKMSVTENGELAYETTELGWAVNKMLGDEEL